MPSYKREQLGTGHIFIFLSRGLLKTHNSIKQFLPEFGRCLLPEIYCRSARNLMAQDSHMLVKKMGEFTLKGRVVKWLSHLMTFYNNTDPGQLFFFIPTAGISVSAHNAVVQGRESQNLLRAHEPKKGETCSEKNGKNKTRNDQNHAFSGPIISHYHCHSSQGL